MRYMLLVAAGGFIGANIRFIISRKLNQAKFPAGTFLVNMIGAFLLGVIGGRSLPQPLQVFLGVGFMGALTTFSTMHLDAEKMQEAGNKRLAYLYLILSYSIGLILTFFGMLLGKSIR